MNTVHQATLTYQPSTQPPFKMTTITRKPIRVWLHAIVDQEARREAFKNIAPYAEGREPTSLANAIDQAFTWDETPQGVSYWSNQQSIAYNQR